MEFLKELFGTEALTYDQLAAAVAAAKKEDGTPKIKIGNLATGDYVGVSKYKDMETTVETLKQQIVESGIALETLKKSSKTSDELKGQLEALQTQYTALQQASDKKIAEIERSGKINEALLSNGLKPKLLKAAVALLDPEALKEDLSGLPDAVKSLKEGTAEFFADFVPGGTGAGGAAGSNPPPTDLEKMSMEEYVKYRNGGNN